MDDVQALVPVVEALEASNYVLVRFEAKKKVSHYVGK